MHVFVKDVDLYIIFAKNIGNGFEHCSYKESDETANRRDFGG